MPDDITDLIYLDVENTLIKCSRDDLIKHSDYFKAMLQGNFVEKDQSQIKIEGVELMAINVILILLWDETYLVGEKDILQVLQTACMLQFNRVKSICLERINEMLRVDNCLRIWLVTEQLSLKPICLKAKLMALQEFEELSHSESLLEFNIEQILDYLGNTYLKSNCELIVFQTGMKWWYEHSDHFTGKSAEVILKLLSCLDFNSLDVSSFNEIMLYPDISNDKTIMEILEAVRKLKNRELLSELSFWVQEKAQLLYKAKSRLLPCYVGLLVNTLPLHCDEDQKLNCEVGDWLEVIHYDKFKRKRVLTNILSPKRENLTVVYYDAALQVFKKFFIIDQNKCENLEGFKILGYKEFVFLYGGQHLIGKGEWNVNFWVYDSVRDRWERKSRLPHCRRHFESCIVGNKIFIVGGIGNYRIIQDNTFFYDYRLDLWSNIITLPQMKCCSFLNKCFFFSIVQKCGYFLDGDNITTEVIKVDALVEEEIFKRQSEYAIFSYRDKLYVKGKDLIELGMENNKLVLKSVVPVTNLDFDKLELTVCNNLVYTFYKYKNADGITNFSLESLDLQSKELTFIFKDLSEDNQIGESNDEIFLVNSKLKIFSMNHYSLVEENTVINDSFRNTDNK